uniref:Uncharacterized protein n=1 Tax=Opuntia streptacantha TaxID=393608 RepID=A0A7C9AXC5_OPUST
MKGIKKRTRKRIINPQKRGRKNIVAEIGIKQGTLIQGRGPLTVTVKIAKTKERQIGRQVAKTMLTEKEKEQRMRKMMDRDINPQEDTKEGVHRRLVTGVNRVREARWLMMIQVVKHQMIQGGRLTQKDVTCHRHLSGLGKDGEKREKTKEHGKRDEEIENYSCQSQGKEIKVQVTCSSA